MAALLVGMAVMAIMLSVAMPVWRTAVQREREAELIFRGEQYAQAIAIFQRKTGGYPPSLDVLEKTRAIRKLYKDPITGGDFQPVYVGQVVTGQPVVPGQPGRGAAPGPTGQQGRASGPPSIALSGRRGGSPIGGPGMVAGQVGGAAAGPIIGVISKSTANSLRLYNGRGKYNEWAFVATAATQQAGAPTGAQAPGLPGRGGRGGEQLDPFGRGGRGRGGQPQNPPGRGLQPPGGGRALPFPGRGIQPRGGRGGFGVQPGIQFPGPATTNP